MLIFFSSFFVITYHILIYGILLKLLSLFKKNEDKKQQIENFPTISVLCPAFNEEKHIEAKIKSFLDLDYPIDKIRIISREWFALFRNIKIIRLENLDCKRCLYPIPNCGFLCMNNLSPEIVIEEIKKVVEKK